MKHNKLWTPEKRQRVTEWVSYWIRMLALEPVNMDVDFFIENHHDGDGVCMDIVSNFPYRSFQIRVFYPMLNMSNRRIGQKVCHELMHYVVKPMTRYRLAEPQYYSDQEEHVVDTLALCMENITHRLDEECLKRRLLERAYGLKKARALYTKRIRPA